MPTSIRKSAPATEIAADLRRRILSGELKPGERLLPERRLALTLRCGLHHLRLAVRQLREEGLLVSRRRSGIQVVPLFSPAAPPADAGGQEGFHMFDVLARPHCRLRFLVSAWSPANRATWDEICRRYSQANPETEVEPFFPTSRGQYNTLRADADLFITTPSVLGHPRELREIRLLPGDVLEGVPLADRYIVAARAGTGGKLLGVPFAGTLLTGMLNRAVCSEPLCARLKSAASFSDALEQLLAPGAVTENAWPLNLAATQTFNLFQLGHLLCGAWFERRANGSFRFNATAVRRVLDGAAALRSRLPPTRPQGNTTLKPSACAAFLQFTYTMVPHLGNQQLIPWLFPPDPRGRTIEGINVGAVRQDSPYPEPATAFLLHLLSDDVQQRLARLPGEHPLSRRIAQPFQSYPESWRPVLAAQQERAWVMADIFPGYFEFVNGVLFPLATRFVAGTLDAATAAIELEHGSRRFLRGS